MDTSTTASLDQALTLYKNIRNVMLERYGFGLVRDLPNAIGFTMQWRIKRDGSQGVLNVFVTAKNNLRVEFTKNVAFGITKDIPENKSFMALQLFNSSKSLVVHNPANSPIMYGIWKGNGGADCDDANNKQHTMENIVNMLVTLCLA